MDVEQRVLQRRALALFVTRAELREQKARAVNSAPEDSAGQALNARAELLGALYCTIGVKSCGRGLRLNQLRFSRMLPCFTSCSVNHYRQQERETNVV